MTLDETSFHDPKHASVLCKGMATPQGGVISIFGRRRTHDTDDAIEVRCWASAEERDRDEMPIRNDCLESGVLREPKAEVNEYLRGLWKKLDPTGGPVWATCSRCWATL